MANLIQFLIAILFIYIFCFLLQCFSTDLVSTLLSALPFVVTLAIFVDKLDDWGLELGTIGSFFAGLVCVLIAVNIFRSIAIS